MDASWQPDPTGRHQYRWWDGSGWTDAVADNGQMSSDPLGGPVAPSGGQATVIAGSGTAPPARYGTPAPTPFSPPGAPSPLPTYTATTPLKQGGKGKWLVLAFLAVAAVAVVAFLVLGGDDGDQSTGRFTVELTEDTRIVTRQIKMKRGEVYRIRVEPPRRVDTRVGLLLSRDDARDQAVGAVGFFTDDDVDTDDYLTDFLTDADELFSDELSDDLDRGYGAPLDEDGGRGEPDTGGLLAFADITVHLVIGAYDDDAVGRIVVFVERYSGDTVSDIDQLSDLVSDEPFFTDSTFFSDSEPYTP